MSASGGAAAEMKPAPQADSSTRTSLYDKIWQHTKLHQNTDNPVIQSLEFVGRFQLDYAIVDHEDFDDLDIRRFRLGGKAHVFHQFTIHSEAELSPEEDPVYSRLTDTYLSWRPRENIEFTAGKQSAPFTMDGSTSSKELLAVDRSNLANNLWFPQEYMPGLNASWEPAQWQYRLGVYSSGSASKEFGNFDGKYFILATLGYDFAEVLNVRTARLAADYVYNEPDARNTFTRPLNHVGSLHFDFETGPWGFRTDLSAASGYLGQSDLWGAMLMPHYRLTRRLQVVARYTFLNSVDNNGVQFARYENQVVSGRGDEYQEFYAGLNYYFYGHKLKVQTGVQHAEMRDQAGDGGEFSGWAWTLGLRISW
jgi:phosphate-selective porin OprO/OprP